ncbi:hypothetical protein [Pararhizobium mangrovi]|uniref:Uncharacterized protein n=1 Tax=Pararhizobium mangrovi TaxID=2590452 RepID=A0A506TYF2_9HYPH|nr:hypothetical protein [Pararhizobium mangrovi]TPW25735.1 hypothetical protein FJU11_18125 [Pararhizobium mangrovi]
MTRKNMHINKRINFVIERRFPSFYEEIENVLDQAVDKYQTQNIRDPRIISYIISKCDTDTAVLVSRENDVDLLNDKDKISKDEKINKYLEIFEEYESRIHSFSSEELNAAYKEEKKLEENENLREMMAWDERQEFSDPMASADFDTWLSMATWTVDEAVSLSLAKEPGTVDRSSGFYKFSLKTGSPFISEYEKRTDQLSRAIKAQDLDKPLRPEAVMAWFQGQGMQGAFGGRVHHIARYDEEVEVLRRENERLKRLVTSPEKLETNSVLGLYRLCLGMAICRYEYRTDMRNGAAKSIAGEFAEVGLSITDDTVRKHLQRASKELGFEWKTRSPFEVRSKLRAKPKSD